jgi:hypothetical protein
MYLAFQYYTNVMKYKSHILHCSLYKMPITSVWPRSIFLRSVILTSKMLTVTDWVVTPSSSVGGYISLKCQNYQQDYMSSQSTRLQTKEASCELEKIWYTAYLNYVFPPCLKILMICVKYNLHTSSTF